MSSAGRACSAVLALACALLAATPAGGSHSDEQFPDVEIRSFALSGSVINLTHGPGLDTAPALSPDGRSLAFVSSRLGKPEIYVMRLPGGHVEKLTTSPFGSDDQVVWNDAGTTSIAWSPDGKRLAFDAQNATFDPSCTHLCVVWSVYVTGSDGSDLHPVGAGRTPSWSPDGRQVAFESSVTPYGESEQVEIAALVAGTRHTAAAFNPDPSVGPAWSPGGRLIAFQAVNPESGKRSVELVASDGSHRRRLAAGAAPAWSRDGRSVVLVRGPALYVVPLAGGRGKRLTRLASAAQPAVAPDGKTLAFLATRGKQRLLGVVGIDGRNERVVARFPAGTHFEGLPVWTKRGDRLVLAVAPPS
jgi:Tol biopolymer transport system component